MGGSLEINCNTAAIKQAKSVIELSARISAICRKIELMGDSLKIDWKLKVANRDAQTPISIV
jgi:hypothetical protein